MRCNSPPPEMHVVMDQPGKTAQETGTQSAAVPARRWLRALAVGMALLVCSCGSGGTAPELNKISKPSLTERHIRNYLAAYAELQELKQKALRAGAPDQYTPEQNDATIQRHGISVHEFSFIGARIDNVLALLDREKTTPIPEAFKADCELVRRMRGEIEKVRKPVPFP